LKINTKLTQINIIIINNKKSKKNILKFREKDLISIKQFVKIQDYKN